LPPTAAEELDVPSGAHLSLVRRVCAFGFLLAAEFFYSWAWNTVDILRPYLRESLGLTLTQAGSAYSAQGAGALAGAILIGQLADRLGRRNLLVAVMLGYGSLLLAGVFVSSYVELLLQRFCLGLFLGGSFPVVVGIYVGLFEPGVRGRLASMVSAVFSASIITQGYAFGHLAGHDWRLLLWLGGVPPILLAFFAYAVVPGGIRQTAGPGRQRLPMGELFAPALRRQTLLLASLTGLNFFAYQAFSGWLTIYLKDNLHLATGAIGELVSGQFAGNLLGCFFWGWVGDRFGRRAGAVGFFVAAAAITVFLSVPAEPRVLVGVGTLYGFCLSASVVWGPWLAELYPEHLRSTAASIFNWGRLISFFAPLITGAMAGVFGLRMSMLSSGLAFCAAGGIWLSLPETLRKKKALVPLSCG
jgi:MFS family permease